MNKFWIILCFGILLRLFLAFSTFHPDLLAFYLGGKMVGEGNILNLYDLSFEMATFNYPPLIYWFFGLFNLLTGGNFYLLKLPYLIFDLSLGLILMKLVEPKNKVFVFGLWMFNPINLYATYMMGQFDIIPTFFTVLSVYLVAKNRLQLSALALGLGIAFKLYPIFLLIPLIILGKTIGEKFKLGILAILPYLLTTAPYLPSAGFRSNALLANQSSKSLYVNLPVSGGEAILLFPVFLIFFYLLIWRKKERNFFWKIYLIPLLLFFIFTHYHPQWLIWITPFLILDLSVERFKNLLPIVLVFITWISSLFFFDPSLTVGIFAPLLPALAVTPDIWTLLNLKVDYNFSRSMLQTIFAASSFYLIYQSFPKKENA